MLAIALPSRSASLISEATDYTLISRLAQDILFS